MQDKKAQFLPACLIIASLFLSAHTVSAREWRELKGDHFIIYFEQKQNFASKVLRKAEANYERIASDLGYARYSNFWTWSNRVKIYIYPDQKSYVTHTGQPEWSYGMADYDKKEILGCSGSQDFLNSILPHEIAHLIFRDFVGFKGEVPLWLDEGVAQWEEEVSRDRIKKAIRDCLQRRALLSLSDIMDMDIRLIKDTDRIHLRTTRIEGKHSFIIIDGENLIHLFYLQSASLVGFLIERYGSDKFTNFCRELRDGKRLEEALCSAYTTRLCSIEELEDKWIEYLKE
ncbi:peptidase MA family metallohydrolase [Candidatus Omnitrophota bacterium]